MPICALTPTALLLDCPPRTDWVVVGFTWPGIAWWRRWPPAPTLVRQLSPFRSASPQHAIGSVSRQRHSVPESPHHVHLRWVGLLFCPTPCLGGHTHDRNHIVWCSLGNRTSYWGFTSAKNRANINGRKRKEIADELIQTTTVTVAPFERVDRCTIQMSWRAGVREWLKTHDAIRVSIRKGVLPISHEQTLS